MRLSLRALLPMLLGVALLPAGAARALSMAPLTLDTTTGYIQTANPTQRSLKVTLEVRLQIMDGDMAVPAAKPLSEEDFLKLIRIRPRSFTLAPGQKRSLPYKILDPEATPPLFLCSVANHSFYRLRVCSRWAGPSSAKAGRP
ncbi:MAG: hypothetical protein VKO00_11075 [Cyanobacteriota bacterium]|nr:hypothetical protein [Cyanobacteriota bacterium]